MLPIKSNTTDQGCSPVSSNCVVWQGPNLSCLSLCTGDTISDVTYKLATELCTVKTQLDLTDLDLSCLVKSCQTCPEPQKTLAVVLDLLITKVCSLEDLIGSGSSSSSSTTYTEPTINLLCLSYTDIQGNSITSLGHSAATVRIIDKVCSMNTTINTHTSQISTINTQIAALQSATGYVPPTVSLSCISGSTTALALDAAITAVGTQFCDLRTALGTVSAITAAMAKQCTGLNEFKPLSGSGTTMSSAYAASGWKTTLTTLSDSFTNLWLTVCDMRASLQSIKSTLVTVDCNAVVVDYVVSTLSSRATVVLTFNGLTTIPANFTDCTGGIKLTISDTAGAKSIHYIALTANKNGSVSVTPTGLNSSLNYTVALEPCLVYTDPVSGEKTTCSKPTITKTDLAPCTVVTIGSITIQ